MYGFKILRSEDLQIDTWGGVCGVGVQNIYRLIKDRLLKRCNEIKIMDYSKEKDIIITVVIENRWVESVVKLWVSFYNNIESDIYKDDYFFNGDTKGF